MVAGEDVRSYSLRELRDRIGVVPQKAVLFKGTIRDNMRWGKEGASDEEIWEALKTAQALDVVMGREGGLDAMVLQGGKNFSGGQRQRLTIARALVNEPKVLLLDEPLGALDAKIRKQMQVELKKIQQEVGITFIYVTHDQEEALSMSDTVVVMNNGEIQQIGSPTDIYNEPENRFVAGFIGESNIIEGTMIRDYLVAFDGFEFECVDK